MVPSWSLFSPIQLPKKKEGRKRVVFQVVATSRRKHVNNGKRENKIKIYSLSLRQCFLTRNNKVDSRSSSTSSIYIYKRHSTQHYPSFIFYFFFTLPFYFFFIFPSLHSLSLSLILFFMYQIHSALMVERPWRKGYHRDYRSLMAAAASIYTYYYYYWKEYKRQKWLAKMEYREPVGVNISSTCILYII